MMLPTSVLALCFSSLTQETRYAGFAWFAIWVLGWFTYLAVSSAEAFNLQQEMFQRTPIRPSIVAVEVQESAWKNMSLNFAVARVQSWVFGFAKFKDVLISMVILIAVDDRSRWPFLFYRISAPMRVYAQEVTFDD